MKRSFLALSLSFFGTVHAGSLDSLSVRFGAGLSKPFVEQRVGSSIPGAGFSREIPSLFTAVVDLESTLRRDRWEAGLALGVDGEVLSVNRLDATGFSVAHASLLGGFRLFQVGASRLWMQAIAGLAVPVLTHDEAADADAELGWRVGSGLAFARGGTRVVLGGTISEVSFRSTSGSAVSTSDWKQGQLFGKVQWDWIGSEP